MEFITVEKDNKPSGYIYVECQNITSHKAHSWREGFLWHRKRECGGVPEFIQPEEPHRHFYGFYPEKSDDIVMVWRCLDPFCNHECRFRSTFNYQTRAHKVDMRYRLSLWP